nr:RHS repeat-associated core domain-containing protein [Acidobacteriota bacterium]
TWDRAGKAGAAAGGGASKIEWLVTDQLGTPRMVVDETGSLAGVKRHDYLPFGEEVGAGTGGRTTAQGYSGNDSVRQKFTGYERDNETGLDFAQARYFSSAQGRFTSADPLFITAERLADPQHLNIYAYAQNNPLKFTDPSGLDVTLEGVNQGDYMTHLSTKVSFKIANINNKVTIVDNKGKALGKAALKELGKSLSGGEAELFKAITDTKNHAVIDTGKAGANDEVLFGGNDATNKNGPAGRNTLDMSEINLLDSPENKGGLSAGDAVAHETLEAYASAQGQSFPEAHEYAGKHFGKFDGAGKWDFPGTPEPFTGKYNSGTLDFNVVKANGSKATMRADVNFPYGAHPNARRMPYFNVTKVRIVP